MINILMNRKVQLAYFPIAFFCIAIAWFATEKGIKEPWVVVVLVVGTVFFVLDRIFKPRRMRKVEKQLQEQAEAQLREEE